MDANSEMGAPGPAKEREPYGFWRTVCSKADAPPQRKGAYRCGLAPALLRRNGRLGGRWLGGRHFSRRLEILALYLDAFDGDLRELLV